MEIHFSDLGLSTKTTLVFFVSNDFIFSPSLQKIDDLSEGGVRKAIENADFTGALGKTLSIPSGLGDFKRVILFGIGVDKEEDESEDVTEVFESELDLQKLGGKIYNVFECANIDDIDLIIDAPIEKYAPSVVAANVAFGCKLRSFRFDEYKTKMKESEKQKFTDLTLSLTDYPEARELFDPLEEIAEGVTMTRNLVTEPSNKLYPESYANICRDSLKSLGVKVEILGEKELERLGMGSLLSVGQGSTKESKVVVMQYNGGAKNEQPVAFIGKGVTFDTGGISLKPSLNMHDMKYDMGGSAVVVGLMRALAGRGAKVNAIGVIGLVENMPDGNATRPGDVVTSMSGQTIEVLNTDAEGRLVLADVLWYTQDRFAPKFMVNLATLTGAIVVSLGVHRAGLFSNDDDISEKLFDAGEVTGDKLWRFPLSKEYDKQIDSKIADVQNIGNSKGAGSITAAQFLQRFVNDVPWAHLDIAGVTWADKANDLTPEGGSGFGVRLLNQFVADNFEQK